MKRFETGSVRRPAKTQSELFRVNGDGSVDTVVEDDMDRIRVILDDSASAAELSSLRATLQEHGVTIESSPREFTPGTLALDPALLVASGANVIATLISALLAYRAARKGASIVIVGKTGRRLEVPRDASDTDLEKYVELAHALDAESVIVRAR